jgi:hypothetical protein
MSSIILRAMVGLSQLLAALAASAPAERVLPGSITLTTTRGAKAARAQVAALGGRLRLDKRVMQHCAPALARSPHTARLLTCNVALHVHDGLGWVAACAPPGLGESLGALQGRAAALSPTIGDHATAVVRVHGSRQPRCCVVV